MTVMVAVRRIIIKTSSFEEKYVEENINMNALSILALLVCAIVSADAFSPRLQRAVTSTSVSNKVFYPFPLHMSDETDGPEDEPFVAPEPAFFDGNKRVRLGRSKDQDGKSNIWSIEPKMEVMEGDENQPNQLFILGGVFAAVAAAIPVFLALTKVLPDPSDY